MCRNPWLAAFCFLLCSSVLPSSGMASAEERKAQIDAGDRTLSPYFAVEGGDPDIDRLPLKNTHADVSISGVIASVKVTQTYRNEGSRPINAEYVFPASTRASVHGMTMTIGDNVIKAVIQERKAAKKTFTKAKKAGKSASLLEQQRPNVFTMAVANIMPNDTVEITLHYTELLVPEDGIYEFVYPTVVGPRYSSTPASKAADTDKWVSSPYLPEGSEAPSRFDIDARISTGIPLAKLACPSHEVDIAFEDESTAKVALKASEHSGGNRDFILQYRLQGDQIQSGLMLYEGEEENFFLLMAQPPERVDEQDIPQREYVFIVDVSGSMNGFPLQVSKKLLRALIGGLRPTDTFNVILFSGRSAALSDTSIPANEENIEKAIAVIEKQTGGGGTELLSAVKRAFELPHNENVSRSFLIITDGYISAEKDVFTYIHGNLNEANVYAFGIGSSVNRYLIEGIAKAGRGETFIATDTSEAPAQAERFREYVRYPLLTNIAVDFEGFEAYAIEPQSIPDLLAQRPILVCGKWRGDKSGSIRLGGISGSGDYVKEFKLADATSGEQNAPLRVLWARTRVAELSDFNFASNDESAREVASLGLTYDLLTQFTSFVAVLEKVRNTGASAEDVKQPLPLPEGVSNLAVGAVKTTSGGARRAPEPEFYLLVLCLAAILMSATAYRRFASRNRPCN